MHYNDSTEEKCTIDKSNRGAWLKSSAHFLTQEEIEYYAFILDESEQTHERGRQAAKLWITAQRRAANGEGPPRPDSQWPKEFLGGFAEGLLEHEQVDGQN